MTIPLIGALVSIAFYDRLVGPFAWGSADRVSLFLWGALAVCAATSMVRYPREAQAIRIVAAGLAIVLSLYAMALGTDFAGADGALVLAVQAALAPAPVLLAITAVLAVWRPSFAAFPALYVTLHKDLTRIVSGAGELGTNDYLPLVEVGIFLAAGVWLLSVLRRVVEDPARQSRLVAFSATLLVATAVGAHFGNYFMSALAKITLDGGPLTWALENPTSALMLNGYNLGVSPLTAAPALFGMAYEAFRAIEIPLNIVTLAFQAGCLLAFLDRRLLIGVTVFFDVMHISIFLLTGALFLPWIVLNSLLLAALMRLPSNRLPPLAIAAGMIATVFGHLLFYNARLGWYDSPQARVAYFTAIDKNGVEARVPGSFFRDASYLLYARHFGYREYRRPTAHVPTSAWGQIGILVRPPEGNAKNYNVMTLGRECAFPVSKSPPTDYDTARPAPFIRAQHTRALAAERAGGGLGHDFYPHHHFSMPWHYRAFNAMRLEDIVGYRYVVETVCLSLEDGAFHREVMGRTETDVIPVVASATREPAASTEEEIAVHE